MRMLGLDVGDIRIGVAITDKSGTIAIPLTVIKNDNQSSENLNRIIKENNIEKIIVGLPYNLKGEVGFQAKKVIDFIENKIKFHGVKVELIDERFTTKISLKALGKKVKNKQEQKQWEKGSVDKISAAVLLNDYLDIVNKIKSE